MTSCGVDNDSNTEDPDVTITDSIDPNEDLTVPEQSDVTQIYLKQALTNLTVGQTLNLTDYIGVLPGRLEDQNATSFTASILTVTDSDDSASLSGTTLSLYRIGTVKLAITANGQYKVFTLEVEASTLLNQLTSFLSGVEDNYTLEFLTTNSLGAEVVDSRVYRTSNYIYSEAGQSGYLLSTKDLNTYWFTLTDTESDDLEVNTPPEGDLTVYDSLFYNISYFSDPSYWRYDSSFSTEVQYSTYNYVLDLSTTELAKFFTSLYISNYLYIDSTYVYPYRVYARVTSNEIRFIPMYANTAGTYTVYNPPLRFTNVGTTSVDVLTNYIESNSAPEKVDTTEIINAFRTMGTTYNYSWNTTGVIYDSNNSVVAQSGDTYQGSDTIYPLLNPLAERKATSSIYWYAKDDMEGGSYTPGGVFSYNGTTYEYNNFSGTDDVSDYVVNGVYQSTSSSGSSETYANWYSYTFFEDFNFNKNFSYTDIFNSYPTINSDGDYVVSGDSDEGYSFITDTLAFLTQSYLVRSGRLSSVLTVSDLEMVIGFEYENEVLTEINFEITIVIDPTLHSREWDYTIVYEGSIYDIGTTDLSELETYLISSL